MHYGYGLPKKPSKRLFGKGCINPRDIVLNAGGNENKIAIGNSIFQLENLSNEEYQITLAWGRDANPIRSPEDDLLDATREAMDNGDNWSVGCSTVRKNA